MSLSVTSILFCAIISVVFANDVLSNFKSSEIVPDVLSTPPSDLLLVNFNNKPLHFGEELTPTQVKNVPSVTWNSDPSSFYTITMTDPDAPSRRDPKVREFLHWLVVNVPGADLSKGETLAAYVGSGPPKGTGLHRYVLLVYRQPGKLNVAAERHIPNNSRDGRLNFSIKRFADQHRLGNPIAGNMYQAQYDDYVPTISKQLSG